jgi:hypothetical protein
MANVELAAAKRDLSLLTELEQRAGSNATAIAVPELPEGADDMLTLLTIADALAAS